MIIRTIQIIILFTAFACTQQTTENKDNKVAKAQVSDDDPESRIEALGIELKTPSAPVANYVNAVRTGNLVFLSGKGPLQANGENITGKVGADLTIEEGYEAARITAINQLSVLKAELGDLSRVKRVVKVLGMVEVFGDKGKHARAAVGMAALPGNIAVEIEMIVEVEN